jgi:hypothetical protein
MGRATLKRSRQNTFYTDDNTNTLNALSAAPLAAKVDDDDSGEHAHRD